MTTFYNLIYTFSIYYCLFISFKLALQALLFLKKAIGINYLHENSLPCLPSLHFVRSCHARFHLQVVYMWKVVHVICMTLLLSWIGLFKYAFMAGVFYGGHETINFASFLCKKCFDVAAVQNSRLPGYITSKSKTRINVSTRYYQKRWWFLFTDYNHRCII